MSVKISELDAISGSDIVTYSSSVVFPVVANSTGNLATYKTSISSVTTYITASAISFASNLTAANLIANTGIYGTIRNASQPNITSVGTLTGLTLSGTLTGTTINAATIGNTGALLTGANVTSTNTITANIINAAQVNSASVGNSGAQITGTIQTAAQTNITSVGTLTGLTLSGTLTGTTINAASIGNSGAQLTGTIQTAAQTNITSVGTLTGLTVSGLLTTANLIPSANNVSNIGDSTHWYNRIFSVSTEALYADLAEKYTADANYEPGTVVVFGGDAEVTVTNQFADTRVAGIISTDPAYIMNAGVYGLPVALRGRVPCKVIGPVSKGDLLVTSDVEGYAKSLNKHEAWAVTFNVDAGNSVFAKSLENNDTVGPIVIEAVVV